MEIETFIHDWLSLSNAYDTKNYLKKWHKDAILDDPSVGKVFKGHAGITTYFETYFIAYQTQTRLLQLEITGRNTIHLEVEFTGEFPGKKIGGIFDLKFKDGKIIEAKADLMH